MDVIGRGSKYEINTENKKEMIGDCLFWLGILCELVVSFTGYAYGGYHEPVIILIGMICFSGKILLSMDLKRDWLVFILCAVYGGLCYYFQDSALVLRILLILLAGRDEKCESVIRVFFWGTLAAMVVTAVLSFLGLHNEVSLTQNFRSGDTTRYCFGFLNPNGFSVFAFKVFIFGLFSYGRKAKWWVITLWVLFCGFVVTLANSKMGMASMLVTTVLFLLANWGMRDSAEQPGDSAEQSGTSEENGKQIGKEPASHRLKKAGKCMYISGLVIMVAELGSIMAILFFLQYIREWYFWGFDPWVTLDKITTGRLQDAYKIFTSVAPNLMGRPWFSDATEVGFFNALYNQGFIFLLLYLILLFWFFHKLYKENNLYGMMLVIGFTLYSYGEAFLPYFNKNGVWMLMMGMLPFLNGFRGKKN